MLEFILFFFSLSHSLLCRASPLLSSLSLSFSFSMPFRLSLTLDLHFNNGEQRNDEDGAAIAIFPKASLKVSWTCSLSEASTANAMLDMRHSRCGWDVGCFHGVAWFVGVGLIQWCRLICGCWVDSMVWVNLWVLSWFMGLGWFSGFGLWVWVDWFGGWL